ncbi:MAG: ABC transporter permease subunit [Gammaproteobacteria bacterium]|nr:ABC transporter permease subunit [Gammaproteobacteria bacterium]
MLWLLLFFLVPFIIVLKISFSDTVIAQPPYTPLWEWVEEFGHRTLVVKAHLRGYAEALTNGLYVSSLLYSFKVAGVATLLCLLIAYPMAYGIARSSPATRNVLLMLVMLPFMTSFLLRVYSWMGLLSNNGVVNNVLLALGIIHEPITLMHTDFSVYVGIVYSYLPFMILPLYTNLEKHDQALLEAAADLGARPWQAFLRITLPLSRPGIIAGSMLVFVPAVGEFVIPSLLGRPDQLMIGRLLYDKFFATLDWSLASAVAIGLLLLLVVPMAIFEYYQNRELEVRR